LLTMRPLPCAVLDLVMAVLGLPIPVPSALASEEFGFTPVIIDGQNHNLETMLYRPDDAKPHPLVIFSHGRATRDPNLIQGYKAICRTLVFAGVTRRTRGNFIKLGFSLSR
jgi:hypothetical protein